MLQSITLVPLGPVEEKGNYSIVYRGTSATTGIPFVMESSPIAFEDVVDEVGTALVTYAVEWGITDDITP